MRGKKVGVLETHADYQQRASKCTRQTMRKRMRKLLLEKARDLMRIESGFIEELEDREY
jgi:hypothetical protein